MSILTSIPTMLIGHLHIYIMVLEMFLWTAPRGRKAFNTTAEYAEQTKVLAANQGLYNGFLAAGLFWGILHPDTEFGTQIQLFFLCCVAVAGGYGGATVNMRIFYIQTVPATFTIILISLLG